MVADSVPLGARGGEGPSRRESAWQWVDVHDPTDADLDRLTEDHTLDRTILAQLVSRKHTRPKIFLWQHALYGALKVVRDPDGADVSLQPEDEDDPDAIVTEIGLVVTETEIVTFSYDEIGAAFVKQVRAALDPSPTSLHHAVHILVGAVMDRFDAPLERLDEQLDDLERLVFTSDGSEDLSERLYRHKRRLLALRRASDPVDPIDGVLDEASVRVVRREVRSIYGRIMHIHAVADDMLTLCDSMIEANLAQIGQRQTRASIRQGDLALRQNNDMRRISAYAALIAAPTAMAGIWGMNFLHMPELSLMFGYPLALGVMAITVTLLYRGFRRAGWL
jgi:magnesium transporter